MIPLIETIVAFAVIMLLLSALVKSLTSVVKNHIDYYSENLKREAERLIRGTVNMGLKEAEKKLPLLKDIQWRRLGEEYLSKENMQRLLTQLGATPDKLDKLEARLEVHKANVRYAFAKRTNNIALAMGLALCLFLNINAFTIWDTLYRDQNVRAKFASSESLQAAMKLAEEHQQTIEEIKTQIENGEGANLEGQPQNAEDLQKEREELEKEREELLKQIAHFQGEVDFGMGRIWEAKPVAWWPGFFYQFLGSLLTGILVSIGAPYMHDILGALARLGKKG